MAEALAITPSEPIVPVTPAPAPVAPVAPVAAVPPVAPVTPAQDWADDWKQKMAPTPESLKTLERFASPKAVMESYEALRARMSSGELKSNVPFPAAGTPEQQAEWRKTQGLPEAPEKYDLTGVTVDEVSKPVVDDFLKVAHATNMTPDQAKAAIKWRNELIAKQVADGEAAYAKAKQETADTLTVEYGKDYRRNMNLISGLLDSHMGNDADLKTNVLRAVETNPGFARGMVQMALAINPTATLFPAGTEGLAGGIEARLAEINKMMKTDRKAYNDPKISGPDGEYFKLLRAYENTNGKPYAG
jgi:hypothetical protein